MRSREMPVPSCCVGTARRRGLPRPVSLRPRGGLRPPLPLRSSVSLRPPRGDGAGLSRQVDAVVDVDGTPPVTTITAPAHSGSMPFTGIITDNGGCVVCFIRRHTDNFYWDGGAWIADPGAANLSASYNNGAGTWTCTDTLPSPGGALENAGYNFIATGFDHVGNTHQVDSVVMVDYHQIYLRNGCAGARGRAREAGRRTACRTQRTTWSSAMGARSQIMPCARCVASDSRMAP